MTQNVRGRQVNDGGQVLAMAYVPSQRFENLYSPADALWTGTLFGDLNKPYCTGGRR
ncbi:MAG: spore coat associated protein CotJA [Clostridia bacterium]|nr:spore coat associated protein CotJA [Clostridia bacterium]